MTTIQKINTVVKQLQQKHIPKAKSRRFVTGVNQLAFSEFTSLNAAGRKIGINRWTGESRIRRTITDSSLSDHLQQLLIQKTLSSYSGYWYCSLDHSQFGPFCIAVLAVSYRKGRAIPIWCQVNVSAAGLVAPLIIALEELFELLAIQSPNSSDLKLVLVMDRWFASSRLLKLFTDYDVYYISRTKSDKQIQLPWDPSWHTTPIREISLQETDIKYRKHKLRLIRSDMKPGMKDPEPWFLLTNLPESISRRQILNRYAERFEIEESFKDIKWLQRLEWQLIKKPEVIRSLLLFIFLGWWLLWRYVAPAATRQTPQAKLQPKKRLSWYRLSWEHLHLLLYTPLLVSPTLQRGREK